MSDTALRALRTHFGYNSFRPNQVPIINSIIAHQNTVALLPTGGGKSVCFQIPGLVMGGTTIVVSPLISLMKDQVDALLKRHIRAVFINSTISLTEQQRILSYITQGHYQFVYVAPERLQNTEFIAACNAIGPRFIAVDEAHCISQWGHDFRPAFLGIKDFVKTMKIKPVVAAFTATATPKVVADIINCLELSQPHIFTQGFKRSNLYLETRQCLTHQQHLFELVRLLLRHHNDSGIIYVLTRSAATQLAAWLNKLSIFDTAVGIYHGGLPAQTRSAVQEAFTANRLPVIVATNAFGMGIDKPNVRFVIHFQISSNLENYYQEAGRAGRDGDDSWCYLLFHPPDVTIAKTFIDRLKPSIPIKHYRHLQRQLTAMVQYANTKKCLNATILQYFGEKVPPRCHSCNHCQPVTHPCDIEFQQRFKNLTSYCQKLARRNVQPITAIMPHNSRAWWSLLPPHQPTNIIHIPGLGTGWQKQWHSYFLEDSKPLN